MTASGVYCNSVGFSGIISDSHHSLHVENLDNMGYWSVNVEAPSLWTLTVHNRKVVVVDGPLNLCRHSSLKITRAEEKWVMVALDANTLWMNSSRVDANEQYCLFKTQEQLLCNSEVKQKHSHHILGGVIIPSWDSLFSVLPGLNLEGRVKFYRDVGEPDELKLKKEELLFSYKIDLFLKKLRHRMSDSPRNSFEWKINGVESKFDFNAKETCEFSGSIELSIRSHADHLIAIKETDSTSTNEYTAVVVPKGNHLMMEGHKKSVSEADWQTICRVAQPRPRFLFSVAGPDGMIPE